MYEYICRGINEYYFPRDYFYKFCFACLWNSSTFSERRKFIKNRFFTKNPKFFTYEYRIKKYLTYTSKYFKVYNSLTRFVSKCKFNYTKHYDFDMDLSLEPLDSFKDNEKIQFIQSGKIYTFTLYDINEMLHKNLLHSEYMLHKPLITKNPFNNLNFEKHDLLNFYIKSKITGFKMSNIVSDYISHNFSLDYIYGKHYIFIKENSIKDFIYNSDDQILYSYVCEMYDVARFHETFKNIKLRLSETDDKFIKKIVGLSKKILYHYLLYSSFSDYTLKKFHYNMFMNKLLLLIRTKPFFWRRKVKPKRIKFNTNPQFNFSQRRYFAPNVDNNMNSQLTVHSTITQDENQIISQNSNIVVDSSNNEENEDISNDNKTRENIEHSSQGFNSENPNYNENIFFIIDCYADEEIIPTNTHYNNIQVSVQNQEEQQMSNLQDTPSVSDDEWDLDSL